MRSMKALSLILFLLSSVKCENKSDLCFQSKTSNSNKYNWSPFYQILLEALYNGAVQDECIVQIQSIYDGLDAGKAWALKVFDVSGRPESMFVYGQNFWHGSQRACKLLNRENNLMMSSEYMTPIVTTKSSFEMKYVTIFANYTTRNQYKQFGYVYMPLQLGICMPQSCTTEKILNFARAMFSKECLPFQRIYNVTVEVLEGKSTSLTRFFERFDAIIILSSFLCIFILVLLMNLATLRIIQEDTLSRVANCFHLKRNFNKLMKLSLPRGDVAILDSVKTLSCFFIMIAHLPVYSAFVYENIGETLHDLYNPGYMILSLGTQLNVDIFFVISAFLLAYNFLKNDELRKNIEDNGVIQNLSLFFKQFMHRYIRLTPAFIFTMALAHLTAVYMKEATPFYTPKNMDIYCPPNSWWRGILYLHSFYSVDEMCGTWTWYLSAEMFYFLICLVGLFIIVKKPVTGKLFFFGLSIFSLSYSFYLNYKENYQMHFDSGMKTLDTLYIAPFARMNPYLAGILGGYFMLKWKEDCMKVKKSMKFAWMLTGSLTLILILFMFGYSKYLPQFVPQLCNSVGRYHFGCLIVWTILIYNFDENMMFKKVLSHSIFVHLNKLSYMMYLMYPIFVYFYRISSGNTLRANVSNIYFEGIGLVVACYFVSICFILFIEIPFYRLSLEFFTHKINKEQNSRL